MEWIELAHDRDRWRARVNAVMRSLRRADHSSRGVLPTVVCRCVWSRKTKTSWMRRLRPTSGLSRQEKKKESLCARPLKAKTLPLIDGTVKWYKFGDVTITIHRKLSDLFSLCDVGNTCLAVMCQHSCDSVSRVTCVFFLHTAFRVATLCNGYKQQTTHKNRRRSFWHHYNRA
jgi:hypothetical protein